MKGSLISAYCMTGITAYIAARISLTRGAGAESRHEATACFRRVTCMLRRDCVGLAGIGELGYHAEMTRLPVAR